MTNTVSPAAPHSHGNVDDHEYNAWIDRINDRFSALRNPLFTVAVDDLFAVYLRSIPEADRQFHTCSTCRKFINTFGSLVTVGRSGEAQSVMWEELEAPPYYTQAVREMSRAVRRAKITGVFLADRTEWGTRQTGPWTHFAVVPPEHRIFRHPLQTPGQAMAEKREDYKNVRRALDEFDLRVLDQALLLLRGDALYRAEAVLGPVEWLRDLKQQKPTPAQLWRAVALAPAGFCHPRSSMTGTLLEDLAAGMDFQTVSRRFAAKMHPLQYQRPQMAPSEGNIRRAEEIVEKLGIAASLKRRYATPEDVRETLWVPEPPANAPSGNGVFGHLTPKGHTDVGAKDGPALTLTWEKFRRTILPDAKSIEIQVPAIGQFTALMTAVDDTAPNIMRWGNPVNLYLWNGGSPCHQWGLTAGRAPLWGITPAPWMWQGENHPEQTQSVLFLIEGAKETRTDGGLALFPSNLRSDLREVRSTIEEFSRQGRPEVPEGPTACGIILSSGGGGVGLQVRTSLGSMCVRIDRWD